MTLLSSPATKLLCHIAIPAVRALFLASVAGCALVIFRPKSTSLRLLTWSGVLYAALAMPLLGWMLPTLPIPTPAFLQNAHLVSGDIQPSSEVATTADTSTTIYKASDKKLSTPAREKTSSGTSDSRFWSSFSWSTFGIGIYILGAMLLLTRITIGLVFARRLLRSSQLIQEHRLISVLSARAHAYELSWVPAVSESELVAVPVTLGALRPTILLPSGWREWDEAKLDAVVAHELSHVARRDALTQRLSLIHRTIFWFSPLAWWLDRRLTELAEQASDEAALVCGADRNKYARTLLEFFAALQVTPRRVWWQGVAMAKTGQAEQRLEKILTWRGSVTMQKSFGLKKPAAAFAIALAVPVIYLAASAHPVAENLHLQVPTATQEQPAPAASNSASANSAPAAHSGRTRTTTSSSSSSGRSRTYRIGIDDEEDQRFVIVSGKSDSFTMSGSSEDARHAEKLKSQLSGDFIWFERDEKSYVIRDQATVERARSLWAPQEELGRQQEELGKQQEALGKQQEELGARMEQVQVKVPDMTAELDKLKAELKALSSQPTVTVDRIGEIQSEIGELQSQIGELQSRAGDQQSKIGEEMGALGEKEGKLGEKQGELGNRQAELAKEASRKMKQIFDEAINNGTAKPDPGAGGGSL